MSDADDFEVSKNWLVFFLISICVNGLIRLILYWQLRKVDANGRLPKYVLIAQGEKFCGFFWDEVIHDKGEFYDAEEKRDDIS